MPLTDLFAECFNRANSPTKGHGGTWHQAKPSIGSVGNMVAEYIAEKEKVKLVHVTYRGGGSAIVDLVAGHLKVGSMTLSTTRPHILAGKIKVLAVSSERRLPEFPDLPTLVELGYRDLVVTTWYSLAGPAGLPNEVVERLNAAVNKAMEVPEVRKHLENQLIQTKAMTPAEATAFMQNEVNKWAPVARRIAGSN
ncbi:MAG: tripartite tricarboxylate transporter substrate binding protein [Betaproteobacteria bacterium]|nr:tripartite tricarboxylate transporter substrate binding protein [Betaproteobacteria bacterium]